MSSSQILYGVRDGELWHVDSVERGLPCKCTCFLCGRALIAKKGEILDHHFAHAADDVNCNPQPETLVHLYAKQQVAKLPELILPPFEVRAETESADGVMHELYWRYQPSYRLKIKSVEIEADLGTIKPDLLFTTDYGRVAVEVYFRHQVPPDKIAELRNRYLSTVEIDLSNLPTNASTSMINAAIGDRNRWQWLHNQHEAYVRADMCHLLTMSTRIFVPEAVQRVPKISMNSLPSRKLANADKLLERAENLAANLRRLPIAKRIVQVRNLDLELRVALHCVQIGLAPTRLPPNLMQTTDGQSALGMHPVMWQTGVFAKFCMIGNEFRVREVEDWVRSSFDDKALTAPSGMTQTTNGFSTVAQALYHFLRNLSAQGLLCEIKASKPWESVFAPIDSSKNLVLARLMREPSSIPKYTTL